MMTIAVQAISMRFMVVLPRHAAIGDWSDVPPLSMNPG